MTVSYAFGRWAAASPTRAAALEIPSDEVFRRIADGDRLAMRTLFARYRVPIYRWLLRIVGDAAAAEDLLNDVFLDVWRNAECSDGRSSVSTRLLVIARTKALSARRAQLHAEFGDELSSTAPDPLDEPELGPQKENREEVLRHSLARLSPEHRELFDLVYYHGKSVRDVAEIVGMDDVTVKTRMFAARRQLAELAEIRTYALALKTHPTRAASPLRYGES